MGFRGVCRVSVAMLLVCVACKKPPVGGQEGSDSGLEYGSKTAPPAKPKPAGLETQRCAAALELARSSHPHITVARASVNEPKWSFDLNLDGTKDCLLTTGESGRNSEYFLYVMGPAEPRFVGSVRANTLVGSPYCDPSKVSHGYCEIRAGELMIHGETQTTTYRFDGERYTAYGPSELSAPREKFRGK